MKLKLKHLLISGLLASTAVTTGARASHNDDFDPFAEQLEKNQNSGRMQELEQELEVLQEEKVQLQKENAQALKDLEERLKQEHEQALDDLKANLKKTQDTELKELEEQLNQGYEQTLTQLEKENKEELENQLKQVRKEEEEKQKELENSFSEKVSELQEHNALFGSITNSFAETLEGALVNCIKTLQPGLEETSVQQVAGPIMSLMAFSPDTFMQKFFQEGVFPTLTAAENNTGMALFSDLLQEGRTLESKTAFPMDGSVVNYLKSLQSTEFNSVSDSESDNDNDDESSRVVESKGKEVEEGQGFDSDSTLSSEASAVNHTSTSDQKDNSDSEGTPEVPSEPQTQTPTDLSDDDFEDLGGDTSDKSTQEADNDSSTDENFLAGTVLNLDQETIDMLSKALESGQPETPQGDEEGAQEPTFIEIPVEDLESDISQDDEVRTQEEARRAAEAQAAAEKLQLQLQLQLQEEDQTPEAVARKINTRLGQLEAMLCKKCNSYSDLFGLQCIEALMHNVKNVLNEREIKNKDAVDQLYRALEDALSEFVDELDNNDVQSESPDKGNITLTCTIEAQKILQEKLKLIQEVLNLEEEPENIDTFAKDKLGMTFVLKESPQEVQVQVQGTAAPTTGKDASSQEEVVPTPVPAVDSSDTTGEEDARDGSSDTEQKEDSSVVLEEDKTLTPPTPTASDSSEVMEEENEDEDEQGTGVVPEEKEDSSVVLEEDKTLTPTPTALDSFEVMEEENEDEQGTGVDLEDFRTNLINDITSTIEEWKSKKGKAARNTRQALEKLLENAKSAQNQEGLMTVKGYLDTLRG